MRIRTQFAAMVAGITVIPVLLIGLGLLFFTAQRNSVYLPNYEELPASSEHLTDRATWDRIRQFMIRDPDLARAYVFDRDSRLIYATSPTPGLTAGKMTTAQDVFGRLMALKGTNDLIVVQPAEMKVWLAFLHDAHKRPGDPLTAYLTPLVTILGIMLVFAMVFSILMGQSLTRSILLLVRAVRRAAEGDLDESVADVRGSNEIRDLAHSFDQLRLSLKEENARRSRFIMGLSHDLRTPLTLIKGYTEWLRDSPDESSTARGAHLQLILDRADQLDTMVEDLIDFSKVSTGEWQEAWALVPLKSFLEELAAEFQLNARLWDRHFLSEIQVPDDLRVACDERSIRRCFDNLLGNALRYTRPGDEIGLRAELSERHVLVTVWDHGPGIDAADLPYVFDLFYRSSTSRRESGMGIGLSVVKTLLESHGWTVSVQSDRGTRFVIHIPRSELSPASGG